MANCGLLSMEEPHSPDVGHCVFTFWPEGHWQPCKDILQEPPVHSRSQGMSEKTKNEQVSTLSIATNSIHLSKLTPL